METITFDMLKLVEALEQVQMLWKRKQAQVIARAVCELYKKAEIMRRDAFLKLGAMMIGAGVGLTAAMGVMTT